MRKLVLALGLLVAAFSFASCEKDNPVDNGTGVKSFGGNIEQLGSDSKTILSPIINNKNYIYWESGDTVSINGCNYAVTPNDSIRTRATFNAIGQAAQGQGLFRNKFYGVYPSRMYGFSDASSLFINLPAVQTYSAQHMTNFPLVAIEEDGGTELHLRGVNALLEITLKGTATVKSIEVASLDSYLWGYFLYDENNRKLMYDEFQLTFAGRQLPQAGKENRLLTLDCGDGVTLNNNEGVPFYISIPAGQHKLAFRITTTDGQYDVKPTAGPVEVAANNLYYFTLTPNFHVAKESVFQLALGTIKMATSNIKKEGGNYSFFPNSYDYIRSDNQQLRCNVDLFRWADINQLTSWPGIDSRWELPTSTDWTLLIGRTMGGIGTRQGGTVNGVSGCLYARVSLFGIGEGLLLCPDNANFNMPFYSHQFVWNDINTSTSIDLMDLWVLEDEGCVFLPAAGHGQDKYGIMTEILGLNTLGYYWSIVPNDPSGGVFAFLSREFLFGNATETMYMPVRLIQRLGN